MALGAKLEMRPALAHCRLGLGELHGRAGRHDLAEPHLAAAAALFGEMGIPSLRDRAARQRLRPE